MFIIITYIIITADEESIVSIKVVVGTLSRNGSIVLVWRLGPVEWEWFELVTALMLGICDLLIWFIYVFGEISDAFVDANGAGKSGLGN